MSSVSKSPYSADFYSGYRTESQGSARVVVPFLIELFHPASVIDVGCGIGTWLAEFSRAGVTELRGYDGDYVDRDQLLIPRSAFTSIDFEVASPPPAARADLAISLEVAEHLSSATASRFVDFLCSCADAIVFSAAVPHQGGTDHINEQWQSHWAKLFAVRGYAASTVVRERFWSEPRCAYYYAQNTVVYLKRGSARARVWAGSLIEKESEVGVLDVVHPVKWEQSNDVNSIGMRKIVRAFPAALQMAFRRRLGGS